MNTPGLFPIVGDRGDSLKRRLQHVLAGARIAPRVGRRWILGACVVTLAAVAGIGFAQQGATPPAPVSKIDGGKSAPAEVSPVVAGNQATRSASTQVARPETAPKPASAAKQVPAASDRTPPSAAKNENGPQQILGTVLLPDGRPAAGAEILALRRYWSNRVSWKPLATTKAAANGEFEIWIPPYWYDEIGTGLFGLAARTDGFGVEWARAPAFVPGKETNSPVVLRLIPESLIHGRVVDLEGRPLSRVHVRVVAQGVPREGQDVGAWVDAMKKGDSNARLGSQLPGYEEATSIDIVSDRDGRFVVRGVGPERVVDLQISGETIATARIEVVTRQITPSAADRAIDGDNRPTPIFGGDFTYQAALTKTIIGTVRDAASGKPLAGVRVELSQHKFICAQTDAEGKFRLIGMPKETSPVDQDWKHDRLVVAPNLDQPYFGKEVDIPQTAGLDPITLDIKLRRGLWITGRVTDKVTGKPVSAVVHYFPYGSNPFVNVEEWRTIERVKDASHRVTSPDGTYRIVGLPWRAIVGVRAAGGLYLTGVGASEIPGMEKNGRFPKTLGPAFGSFENALKEINPTPGTESAACDLALDPGGKLRIAFVDGAGKPVEDGYLLQLELALAVTWGRRDATFELAGLAPKESRTYQITQWQRKIAKVFTFEYDEKASQTLTVKLEPCATVRGRLLDEEGSPLKNVQVFAEAMRNGHAWFSLYTSGPMTDADGHFAIENLAAGCDSYKIRALDPKLDFVTVAEKVSFAPGKTIDLGEIKIKRDGSDAVSSSDAQAPTSAPKTPVVADVTFSYEGKVLDDVGLPVAGAQLMLQYWREGPPERQAATLAVTDAHGRFQFTRRKSEFADAVPSGIPAWRYATIVATKDGLGFAFDSSEKFETSGRLMAELTEEQRRRFKTQTVDKPAVLKLVPDDVPVRGRLVNIEGQPIADAIVRTLSVHSGTDGTLDAWVAATKQRGADQNTAGRSLRRIDTANSAIVPVVRTGADGRFTLRGIGRERIADILVSAPNVEMRLLHVLSRRGEPIKLAFDRPSAASLQSESFYPNEFTGLLGPSIPVEGRITDRKTGRPLADCVVKTGYTATDPHAGLRPSSSLASDYLQTLTDSEGRYRLEGLPLGKSKLIAVPPLGTRHLQRDFDVTTTAGSQPLTSNVQLTAGILVRGQVTDSRTGKPVMGNLEYLASWTNPDHLQINWYSRGRYRTDHEGGFEIPVLPGKGVLLFQVTGGPFDDYPRGVFSDHVDGLRAAPADEFRQSPYLTFTSNAHLTVPIDLEPQPDVLSVKLTLRSGVSVSGRVLTPESQPLSGYYFFSTVSGPVGASRSNGAWRFHEAETFTLAGYFPTETRTLMFYHPARNLVGVYRLSGEPPEKLEITLHPGARIVGQLIDDDGQPLKNAVISRRGRRYPPPAGEAAHDREQGVILTEFNGRHVLTDQDGRFELPGIIPGLKYSADVRIPQEGFGKMSRSIFGQIFTDVTAGPGEVKQLGVLRVKPSR